MTPFSQLPHEETGLKVNVGYSSFAFILLHGDHYDHEGCKECVGSYFIKTGNHVGFYMQNNKLELCYNALREVEALVGLPEIKILTRGAEYFATDVKFGWVETTNILLVEVYCILLKAASRKLRYTDLSISDCLFGLDYFSPTLKSVFQVLPKFLELVPQADYHLFKYDFNNELFPDGHGGLCDWLEAGYFDGVLKQLDIER